MEVGGGGGLGEREMGGGGGGERGWGSTHCCHLVNEWMRKMGDIWQRCRDGGRGYRRERTEEGVERVGMEGGGQLQVSSMYICKYLYVQIYIMK